MMIFGFFLTAKNPKGNLNPKKGNLNPNPKGNPKGNLEYLL
jgi:hypothetical protein